MAALRYWVIISGQTERILFEKTVLLVRSLEEFCQSQAWYWFGALDVNQKSETDLAVWWEQNGNKRNRSSFTVNLPWGVFLQNWIFTIDWTDPAQLEASIDWAQFQIKDEGFLDRFSAFLMQRAAIDAIEFSEPDGKMTRITGKQIT
jgi:hypothetical protein